MREAIGGTWLLGFVVAFIVLFSSYLAISINYTKAFKVKNQIINIIEENEGYTYGDGENTTFTKINKYLDGIGYNAGTNVNQENCPDFVNGTEYILKGYCVTKKCVNDNPSTAYYKVSTFINIEVPLVSFSFLVPINGETRTIYRIQDDFTCAS